MKASNIFLSSLLLHLFTTLTFAQDVLDLTNYTKAATTYRCGNPSTEQQVYSVVSILNLRYIFIERLSIDMCDFSGHPIGSQENHIQTSSWQIWGALTQGILSIDIQRQHTFESNNASIRWKKNICDGW